MNTGLRKKAEPLESFSSVFTTLKISGYMRLFQPRNQCTKILHQVYRSVAIVIVTIYISQHVTYAWMVQSNTEKFREALVLAIPLIILYPKALILYYGTKRIDALIEVMADPIFSVKNYQDELYMNSNKKNMLRLWKITNIGLSCVCLIWAISPVLDRLSDETATVPSYMPFTTNTWSGFLLGNFLDKSPVLWCGYGHFNIDCFVASLYSQARVQLRIIRYNLEHLVNEDDLPQMKSNNFKYLDTVDETLQQRFVHYVQRYEKILWFTSELTDIFGKAILLQFFLSSLSTCLVVYQASSISPFSIEFAFCIGYYLALQFQNFIYCYYGGMVEYESKFVGNSAYLGGWVRLSARFRRQLLIAMARWTRPITPTVAGIIPLSLTTFMTITRSAYTLYTVLKSKNNRENGGKRTLSF